MYTRQRERICVHTTVAIVNHHYCTLCQIHVGYLCSHRKSPLRPVLRAVPDPHGCCAVPALRQRRALGGFNAAAVGQPHTRRAHRRRVRAPAAARHRQRLQRRSPDSKWRRDAPQLWPGSVPATFGRGFQQKLLADKLNQPSCLCSFSPARACVRACVAVPACACACAYACAACACARAWFCIWRGVLFMSSLRV